MKIMKQWLMIAVLICGTTVFTSGEGQLENREWWEIKSIENGVMTWTALRLKGDGSTYIVTFELSKVEDSSK